MAIDTRQKLFSLLRLNKPYMVNLPDPTLLFDQGDLQQFLHGYSGILWAEKILIIGSVTISMNLIVPEITMQLEIPND